MSKRESPAGVGTAPSSESKRICIAVVNYSFPVTTQTFHHRRARHLDDIDVMHSINFVQPSIGQLPTGAGQLSDRAQRIRRSPLAIAAAIRQKPARRLLIEGTRLARSKNGEGGRLGFIWQAIHGMCLGASLRSTGATHIHACFATGPATIGMFASLASGLPLSLEVHTPQTAALNPELLAMKLEKASSVFAISAYTAALIRELAPSVHPAVIHCGLDLPEPGAGAPSPAEHSPAEQKEIDVLAVGSLAPKKGHDVLIRSLAELGERGLRPSATIVGEGPERPHLVRLIEQLQVDVHLAGQLSPEAVGELRSKARLGVLASVRTLDGDEDGIPVALMEFMADGIPVVSTDIAGIAELLASGAAGAVVAPGDSTALASAIEVGLADKAWRRAAAEQGELQVRQHFDNRTETDRMIEMLRNQP